MNKEMVKKEILDEIDNAKTAIRNKVIFSRIDKIPNGDAANGIIEGCLVLEGGAFRAVYGEGVLDAFLEEGINLSCVIGVSAGAMNGMNYCSGQIGRSARTNLKHRFDPRYVGAIALTKNKGLIGFDYVFDSINEIDPFNYERFDRLEQRFIAVATDCLTGKPRYFEKGICSEIFKAIQASASMPYISEMVKVENIPCLDGGCSCPIPYEWAYEHGYDKVVIVKTRHNSFRKSEKKDKLVGKVYNNYPEFAESVANSHFTYNKQCNEIAELEEEGKAFVIAPSVNVQIGRLEHDIEKLGDWYFIGYEDGKKAIPELKEYLGIK